MASEETKKKAALGGFGVLVVGVLVYNLYGVFAPPPPRPQVAPVIIDKSAPGSVGTSVATSAAPVAYPSAGGKLATPVSTVGQLDPTLHMEGMLAAESLVYTGTGRNIFSTAAQQQTLTATAVAPKFPARPNPAPQPVTPVNLGPPPPQPVNLKFFGTATQDGVRKALLLGGDDVFLASKGDVVQRRYKIINIAANSIVIEDMPNTNQQTLPLLVNP